MTVHTAKRLQGLVDAGLSLSVIADHEDMSYNAVRAKLYKHGLKAKPTDFGMLRHEVMGMKSDEAVEYLLSVIENLAASFQSETHEIDTWGHFTPHVRKLLITLYEAEGRTLSKSAIMDAMYSMKMHDAPDEKIVDVYVCKARKRLNPEIAELKTHWGVGYSLCIKGRVS